MKGYIPSKDNNLLPWSDNLKEKIGGYAQVLGLAPEEVEVVEIACSNIDRYYRLYHCQRGSPESQ